MKGRWATNSMESASKTLESLHQEIEEKNLVARCQGGEEAAFEELIIKYEKRVFAVAFGMLGDADETREVSQEAFVAVYKQIGSFRGDAKLSTWIIAIVIRLCRCRRRWWYRRKLRIAASLDEMEEVQKESILSQVREQWPTADKAVIQTETKRQLISALRKLDERDKMVIILRGIKELSYEEIAGILNCRIGTVKSRLNRARQELRKLLKDVI